MQEGELVAEFRHDLGHCAGQAGPPWFFFGLRGSQPSEHLIRRSGSPRRGQPGGRLRVETGLTVVVRRKGKLDPGEVKRRRSIGRIMAAYNSASQLDEAVAFCVLEKLSTCIPVSTMIPDDVDFLLAFSHIFRLAQSASTTCPFS